MFRFIVADLRRNRIGAAILVLLVALATGWASRSPCRSARCGSAAPAPPLHSTW